MNKFSLLRINHQPRIVEKELVSILAHQIVPQLKTAIETAAQEIAQKYEPESPLAVDAAADLLLEALIGVLDLSEVDDFSLSLQRHQMRPDIVLWWLGAE